MRTGREPYEITVGLSNSRTPDERPERGRGAVEREHGASRNLRAPGSKSVALNSLRGQDWALGGAGRGQGHRPEPDGVGTEAVRSGGGGQRT